MWWPFVVLLLSVPGGNNLTSQQNRLLAHADAVPLLVDCGGPGGTFGNLTWIADRFFSSGAPGVVSEPHHFPSPPHRTLRFFPPSSCGARNCYRLPLATSSRFHLRLFSVYDNYDSLLHAPSFDVSLSATLLFSFRHPWPGDAARYGAFADAFAFASGDPPHVDVCFRSVDGDAPVVGTIEVRPVDGLAYNAASTGDGVVLVNYGRLSCGDAEGIFDPEGDRYGRIWQPGAGFLSPESRSRSSSISTSRQILGTDLPPNHFPALLYQSAIISFSPTPLIYYLDLDPGLDYMLSLHFAEIDPAITAPGQRVFDVVVAGNTKARIDVFAEVGAFAAFRWQYVLRNATGTRLEVRLVGVVGEPMINGLENYAVVPVGEETRRVEVEAMEKLKESLGVPERMGWNGDPCAPEGWDPWEGVTCKKVKGVGYVITHLDLSGRGLKGYISHTISFLSNLVSMNMSYNSLKGALPPGVNQESLLRLDLSGNKLSGRIPGSFGSSSMQLVLLNDNELEGPVPEKLYTVGVNGGEIDLSGNKGLCGAPSLPECPFFWQKKNLTTREKIMIGSTSAVFIFLIILLCCVLCKRRGRSGYNFAYSDDLACMNTARRPRYQRQKSLMQLEMESQHAKGFPSVLTPF